MKPRLRHRLEYVALRGLAALLGSLPYRAALAFGWGLAWVGFHLLRFRRHETETRIRQVFGARLSPRQIRRVAWESLRNLCFTAVDMLRTSHRGRSDALPADYAMLVDTLRKSVAAGRGGVIALPHAGSWEMAGLAVADAGIPIFTIAGRQRNPLFDDYVNHVREVTGMRILTRGASPLREIIRELKAHHFFALLPDVRVPAEGVSVTFLGYPANVGTGMAKFARHAGVPIYPLTFARHGWTRHHTKAYPVVEPDVSAKDDADVLRMTQEVFNAFTEAIMADPGQWFWYNKRWILEPIEGGRQAAG